MEKTSQFAWLSGHTVFAFQIPFLVGLPFYFIYAPLPSLQLILISLVLFVLTQLGITAGYHRLFSHKTFKTNTAVRAVLLFFGGLAGQQSALQWCYRHRCHHSFEDTERDPYSIQKGFWFAHFGWMFQKPEEMDKKIVADLLKDPLIVFQWKYGDACLVISSALTTGLVGWICNDFLGALMIAFGLRLFCNLQFAFLLNSLSHMQGSRPYNKDLTATDNLLLIIPTMGEGFHHFHHAFPNDYRTGFRWFHFDPTKWLIWSLSKLGLATDLKATSSERIFEQARKAKTETVSPPENSF